MEEIKYQAEEFYYKNDCSVVSLQSLAYTKWKCSGEVILSLIYTLVFEHFCLLKVT